MDMPKLRFKADDGSSLPEWQQKRFGDIMKCYSGGTPSTSEKTYYGGSIPFLKSGEIHLSVTQAHITELGLANSSAKLISKGDLLYALYGATSGDVAISKIDAAINQAVLCIVPHHDNRIYLKNWLELNRNRIISKYLQGGQGNLSAKIVKSLIVPIPSIAEQHKIADLLLTVDSVIDKQQAEITTWEQYKKGVVQKLFDQEVRFKTDDGSDFPNWECKTLGELGTFYGGLSGKSKEDFVDGTCPYITYKNVYLNTFATPISDDKVKITPQERQNKVKQFDVLFTQSSETFEEVGLSSVYLYDDEPYLNSFCKGFRFNNLEQIYPKFIGYLLRSDKVRHDIILMGQGISRINLRTQYLSKLNFKLPSLAEQRKIAECLDAIDDVIALAKAELEKWRELKQGLLQQLFV